MGDQNIRIKVGDKVDVFFSSGSRIFGDVLYMPNGAGDCWIIQSYYEGKKDTYEYIQNFERISFRPKKSDSA